MDDFFTYFSLVRHRLLTFLAGSAASQTYPDPVAHCEICHWMNACSRRRRGDDHLGFVANIRTLHIAEFTNWNLKTLAALGGARLPFVGEPQRASLESLERAQRQARVQFEARVQNRLIYEPLPLVPSEGLFRLPAPSPGDVFLDLEGDPFVGEAGHEFLFGYAYLGPNAPRGMEFLYSLNRLNVATSRAKCAVVLVASPKLFEPDCQTPRQMQQANAFSRYVEKAKALRV